MDLNPDLYGSRFHLNMDLILIYMVRALIYTRVRSLLFGRNSMYAYESQQISLRGREKNWF